MSITKTAALKEVRAEARKYNMTFKESGSKYNNEKLYQLCNRISGEALIINYRLWNAYWDVQHGEFKDVAKKEGLFVEA